jgi:hypothetical protein
MYRILVTGSRDWRRGGLIHNALVDYTRKPDPILVHGDCKGADWIARDIWKAWGLPDEPHPAPWRAMGRRAGYVRNADMVNLGADVCLAFIRNRSRGATMCADLAERAGIPVIRYTQED